MAEARIPASDEEIQAFLDTAENDRQREESQVLLKIMGELTGAPPVLYSPTIMGFGSSTVTYANGKTLDWFNVGFSPRKGKFSLYLVDDAAEHEEILGRLGPYKHGKACIWVKRLSDIDLDVLREMIQNEVNRHKGE